MIYWSFNIVHIVGEGTLVMLASFNDDAAIP